MTYLLNNFIRDMQILKEVHFDPLFDLDTHPSLAREIKKTHFDPYMDLDFDFNFVKPLIIIVIITLSYLLIREFTVKD